MSEALEALKILDKNLHTDHNDMKELDNAESIIEQALKDKEKTDRVLAIIKEKLVVGYDESENDESCLMIGVKGNDDTVFVFYDTFDKEKIDLLKEVLL